MHKRSFCVMSGQDDKMTGETLSNLPAILSGRIPAKFEYEAGEIRPTGTEGHFTLDFKLKGKPFAFEVIRTGLKIRTKCDGQTAKRFEKEFKTDIEVAGTAWFKDAFHKPSKNDMKAAVDPIIPIEGYAGTRNGIEQAVEASPASA